MEKNERLQKLFNKNYIESQQVILRGQLESSVKLETEDQYKMLLEGYQSGQNAQRIGVNIEKSQNLKFDDWIIQRGKCIKSDTRLNDRSIPSSTLQWQYDGIRFCHMVCEKNPNCIAFQYDLSSSDNKDSCKILYEDSIDDGSTEIYTGDGSTTDFCFSFSSNTRSPVKPKDDKVKVELIKT